MNERPEDQRLSDGLAAITAGAQQEARRDFWHHYWPRIVAIVAAVALIVGGGTALAVFNLYGRQATTDAAVTALRAQADASKVSGDKANSELSARGQAQVPIPQPGSAPDTDVIVASATAKVLASLPDLHPSASQLGQAVATYLANNLITPPGPTAQQISSALAGYFATSPPPSGPPGATGPTGAPGSPGTPGTPGVGQTGAQGDKGDTGATGPAPSADEIQAAFVQYLHDHPDALCPDGGTFAQLRVALADGSSADTYTCVVAAYPASSTAPIPLPLPTG